MRTGVKIFIGLSMPALAVAALWFWSLSRRGKRGTKRDNVLERLHEENAEIESANQETMSSVHEAAENNVANLKNLNGVERLETHENVSGSLGSEKDDISDKSSSDSHSESINGDLKRVETAGCELENVDAEFEGEETWEIEFPQALCGRLIGKKGKNVQKISQVTGTKIRLIPQKDNTESSQRLVALTGTRRQLSAAVRALRVKFPSVAFTRLNGSGVDPSLDSTGQAVTCVVLPEQEMFNLLVTNIVDANHFYVQLYDQIQSVQSLLRQLDQQMYQWYTTPGQGMEATVSLHHPVSTGMVCASLSHTGWWWRAQVVGLLMKPNEVEVTWLDYGGKATVPTGSLRQLRDDFLQLPFQAVECYLSNVIPHQGESSFSMAACALLEGFTQNVVLTARITNYNRDQCPYLELYAPQWTGQTIFVNREMVRRGFARWSET